MRRPPLERGSVEVVQGAVLAEIWRMRECQGGMYVADAAMGEFRRDWYGEKVRLRRDVRCGCGLRVRLGGGSMAAEELRGGRSMAAEKVYSPIRVK